MPRGAISIVMAQVSPGAEIMADGNIHVYATLKGRALAGVQGNLKPEFFVPICMAQLIAIAADITVPARAKTTL
jgi:septum site-determining protein MinC